MHPEQLQDLYNEGFEAATFDEDGKPDCPYPKGSEAGRQWRLGFADGLKNK